MFGIMDKKYCYGCNKDTWSGTWYNGEYYDSNKDILFCDGCISTGVHKKLQTRTECIHSWFNHSKIRVCNKCNKVEDKP